MTENDAREILAKALGVTMRDLEDSDGIGLYSEGSYDAYASLDVSEAIENIRNFHEI